MLHCRFPKVRKMAAEQLYIRLVAVPDPLARGFKDLDLALDVSPVLQGRPSSLSALDSRSPAA